MYTESATESYMAVHTRYVPLLAAFCYQEKVGVEGIGMQAEDVDSAAVTDAELGAELVGSEGDVSGGDIGLGILLADGLDAPLVQRGRFQDPVALAEGPQLCRYLRACVQVRMLAQLGEPVPARQLKCPGLKHGFSGFIEVR